MTNVPAFLCSKSAVLVAALFSVFVSGVARAQPLTAPLSGAPGGTSTPFIKTAYPVPAEILALARSKNLAQSEEWRRLLHYRKDFFGGWTSEADGLNFFVASHGRTEPELELEATLIGFFTNEKRALEGDKQPPQSVQCQFPARFDFLNRELGLAKLVPPQDCPEFKEFRERMSAQSVTLVFSSFYAGNPGSTFGHSLLRFNKARGANGTERQQLLDYGINYAANQTTSNPILYSLFGLAGLFRGTFTGIPYYYKVREYGDFESRDLWEYDLSLSDAEVARVVMHLWELGSTYFDYYFLTENCSYHMLTLIEAAAPRTHLVNRVPFYVIPTDTIKAVFEDGLVGKTNFRASLSNQFLARKARLNKDEETELLKLVDKDRDEEHPTTLLPPETLTLDARARIADAYMDYVDLHYAKKLYLKEKEYADPKDALLIARSKLPLTKSLDFSNPPVASPNEAHPSARWMILRAQNQNHGGATDFAVRSAFHDLMDPPRGMPEADIDFFHLVLRVWDQPARVRVEHAVLFGVGTFSPLNSYTKKMSWRAKIGIDRVDDARCTNCLAGGVYGGAGYSTLLFEKALTYALIDAEGFTSPDFISDKFTLRGGPTLGLRLRFSEALAWLTEARYFWAANGPSVAAYQIDTRLRLVPFGSLWGLDARAIWRTEGREVTLGVVKYF